MQQIDVLHPTALPVVKFFGGWVGFINGQSPGGAQAVSDEGAYAGEDGSGGALRRSKASAVRETGWVGGKSVGCTQPER